MNTSVLPVSRKFYTDIESRISFSLASSPGSAKEAMRLVETYLYGDTPVSSDPMALLAFNMVKAEIDRAMVRSQRARIRARSRKKDRPSAKMDTPSPIKRPITEPKEAEAATTDSPCRVSRRERRAASRRRRTKWRPLSSSASSSGKR